MMNRLFLCTVMSLLILGCSKNDPSTSECEYVHSIGLSLEPMKESILVNYGFFNWADGPIDPAPSRGLSCEPESIELSISTDGVTFEKVATLTDINGDYTIDNLEDCEMLIVKIEGKHSDLRSTFATRTVLVGEIETPQFLANALHMESFTISTDEDQFIYSTVSDRWHLSSFSNQTQGQQIFDDVSRTRWNPTESNKIAGVENILVPILPNVNGSTSKYLVEYDMDTGTREILHEIQNHMDFNNDVYDPEQYWIHEFNYSLDGKSIYFMSNKDNGGNSNFDQKVYDNIWKLDLETKEIEALTDFISVGYDLADFVEDPKQVGNFYISGGERDVEVMTDDNSYFIDRIDIHYYDSNNQTITPIYVNDEETNFLSIDPTGENLVYSTTASGSSELRSLNISSMKHKQLTYSNEYRPLKKWSHINWLSSSEFITNVIQDGDPKFAIFKVE